MLFPLTMILLLIFGCKEEEPQMQTACEKSCENEQVIESIHNGEYKVSKIENLPFQLVPLSAINKGKTEPDEILVPCNLPKEFQKEGLVVLVSGNKKNCCNLLTLPNYRVSWGCKFEISSIEKLESVQD